MKCNQNDTYVKRKIETADSWDLIDRYEKEWDLLWQVSESYKNQLYSYQFVKSVCQAEARSVKNIWVILYKEDEKIIGIKPFLFRRIKTFLKLDFRCAMSMPGALIHRHGLLTKDENSNEFFKCIGIETKKSNFDMTIITGVSELQAKKIASLLCDVKVRYSFQKHSEFMQSQLPGMHPADLCAVAFDGSFEQFLKSRKKKCRDNWRYVKRIIEKAGNVEFVRYFKDQFISGDKNVSREQIIKWIEEIEDKCWQKTVNRHFYRYGKDNAIRIFENLWESKVIDVSFILLDNIPLSYSLGSCVNDHGCVYFTAFKADASKLSPGIVMWFEIIRTTFLHTTMKSLNFTGSNHLYKHQIADLKDSTFEFVIYGKTLKANFLYIIRKIIPHRIFAFISKNIVSRYGVN